MTFKKNHKLGANKIHALHLDAQPIGVRSYEGQKEALKSVPNWQEPIRQFIDALITEESNKKPSFL